MGLESIAAMPIAIIFVLSGLLFNFIQLLLMLFVLPFSRQAYRRINAVLSNSYWSQVMWLEEWWGRLKLVIFCDPEHWAQIGKESAIALCNHRSDVDWAVGWTVAQRTGVLGSTRALMKQVVKYLPIIGWSMWFSEYVFLARDWAQDQAVMKTSFERLRDFPIPFWLAIFPEGTRFTPQKLQVAQEFAHANGLPVPHNTLVPRTKGFVMSVEYLRDFVPSIVDVTVKVPEGVPNPTFGGFLNREKSEMHVHVRRVSLSSLPRDSEGIAEWCREAFRIKEAMLEEHKKINSFDPNLLLPMEPSKWPIFHIIAWSSAVIGLLAWAVVHYMGSAALTWQTGLVAGGVVLLSGAVVQILIYFTKSEYSTPLSSKSKSKPKPRPVNTPINPAAAANSAPAPASAPAPTRMDKESKTE